MEEMGSEPPLRVRVMPGCLILTTQKPLPTLQPKQELMQTLRKVCKLSARKQKQMAELIKLIKGPQQ